MRLLLTVSLILLGTAGVSGAQSVDCTKLLTNCSSPTAKKYPSSVSCLKKAPPPIQKACAPAITAFESCERKCDRGQRGLLCRSKCGTAAKKAVAKRRPKSKPIKTKIVKKPGHSLKDMNGKKVRPLSKQPKTGKYRGKKRPSVKKPQGRKVRPVGKPKTSKYQGKKRPSVKKPQGRKVRPVGKPKTSKYQGKKRPSVKKPEGRKVRPVGKRKTGKFQGKARPKVKNSKNVRSIPMPKSKKPITGTKRPAIGTVKGKKAQSRPAPRRKPVLKGKPAIKKASSVDKGKAKALKKGANKKTITKDRKVKKPAPVIKATPKRPLNRASNFTAPQRKAKPTVKSLRSKNVKAKALNKKAVRNLPTNVTGKAAKKRGTLKKAPARNVARCRKDKSGRLVCKPGDKLPAKE